MRKKRLSCLLSVIMLMSIFVCKISAETNNIVVDISTPIANPSSLTISDGKVSFTSKNQYVDYEVDVTEAGSYYVNFRRNNSGASNFYIFAEVNGKTVNRRTGRIQNADGSYTFQDEVQLEKGKNTVRVGNMSNYAGYLSDLSLTKLDSIQYTTSMNVATGSRIFKASYKSGLGVDPWLWINDAVADYPDGDAAPYITFEVIIQKEGYYYPMAATAGANKIKLSIADEVFPLNDNCSILEEKYKASSSATCSWLKYNDVVYLEAGTHDVTLSVYGAAGANWNAFIGAVRFIEMEKSETSAETIYEGDFVLNVTQPVRTSGAEISEGSLFMTSGSWVEYDVYVSENASYYVNFRRENAVSDKAFYIEVSANGKTVNRRTGKVVNSDGSHTFQNEIQLKKGKNTIRVSTMGSNSGIVSELSLSKLEKLQFTTSMNVSSGTRSFKAAYKSGLGVDPWLYIDETVSAYAPNNAPYVTFDAEVLYDGYYYPEIARSGSSYANMYIDGQSFDMHGNAQELEEKYISSGLVTCTWKRSNDAVYLTKGTHEVTIKLVGANLNGSSWRLAVGAIRFTEASEQHLTVMVEGEDAKLFLGNEKTPVEFDSNGISLYQTSDDTSLEMSGASVAVVHTPVSDAPVTMTFDVFITNACEYNLDILRAHDVESLSEGKLSIISCDSEKIIEDIILNDDNVTVIQSDYLKCSDWGMQGLDIVRLNQSIYLPKGKNTITLTFDADDLGEEGNAVDLILDAFKLTEVVDMSGMTAKLAETAVCIGEKTKVKFENDKGLPIYLHKLNSVDFISSDETVATVNDEGIVRGLRPGNVEITVRVDGSIFTLPMSVTAENGLIIKSAKLNNDGNVEITYIAKENEKFDVIVANYDVVEGKKTSLRGVFNASVIVDDESEKTIIITKPDDTTGFGYLYEIYFWETEDSLNSVYQKIQIQ